MSYRMSFILLVLVVVVGGYVLLYQLQHRGEVSQPNPWFYNVGYDDITKASITLQGDTQRFAETETGWVFEDGGEPVNTERWGGIVLLLTGPRSSRLLEEQATNLEEYGLEPPRAHISITLVAGTQINVFLGDDTPDGTGTYTMVSGSPRLFTVPQDWAGVITRLVTEPPIITPTPEPVSEQP